MSGVDKKGFKHEPKTQLKISKKNTKPKQPQQRQIKGNDHTIAQSNQLRDHLEQTCDSQCPLSINRIMLKHQ